ncbi:MAG: S8 family serine peptidase, partial [Myxococcota bacterium]|nr:S8 family serine peptidase [Myxococcota bacterium]
MPTRPLLLSRPSPWLPLCLLLLAAPAASEVPFPACQAPACTDPADFASYLFLPPGVFPNDYDPNAGGSWKYNPGIGMDIEGAWQITTGRPDVVVAVLDSGIRWRARDLARKVALNTGELPIPAGCASHDCNGDGFVSVDDFPDTPDTNGNGLLDGQDLIRTFSDGVDDDGNGFVDDIAGWDFADNDNDPDDQVDYGHGTGEAEDSTGEANNGSGMPGVAPNAMFLPLKVADSFIAVGSDFAQAVVYSVDIGADVVQEALGTISAGPASQAAIDYAYRRGVPVMASAADESSRHHNFPAVLDHTIWLNSIVEGDGTIVEQEDVYDLFNGCTNHGGRAWTAISSNACSSEAVGRGSGMAALLVSHGKNLVDRGLFTNYPGLDKPFSAEEIRQLFRRSAEDIDYQGLPNDLTMFGLLRTALSAPLLGLFFDSSRVATQPGWDEFTGYGRANMPAILDVSMTTMPPEADLSGSIAWFDIVDPVATPSVEVTGSAAARRSIDGSFDWVLEVGCGVNPVAYLPVSSGSETGPVQLGSFGSLDAAGTATSCGFDPSENLDDPDGHAVTLRLQVRDAAGNLGEDRRTLAIHHDPTLKVKVALGTSAEGSPALADVDGNGVLDIIYGLADGSVQVRRGDTGAMLPGFPAFTNLLPQFESLVGEYANGEVPLIREAIIGPSAADDLDGDGTVEIVVPGIEGQLYVFGSDGQPRAGFPVSTDPALSNPDNRNRLNDTDPGLLAAPTLVDLDVPGTDPALEIVVAAWDGHVYAWRHDGTPVSGYPVRIADRSKVS